MTPTRPLPEAIAPRISSFPPPIRFPERSPFSAKGDRSTASIRDGGGPLKSRGRSCWQKASHGSDEDPWLSFATREVEAAISAIQIDQDLQMVACRVEEVIKAFRNCLVGRSGFRHDLDNSSACVRRAARSVPAACYPRSTMGPACRRNNCLL